MQLALPDDEFTPETLDLPASAKVTMEVTNEGNNLHFDVEPTRRFVAADFALAHTSRCWQAGGGPSPQNSTIGGTSSALYPYTVFVDSKRNFSNAIIEKPSVKSPSAMAGTMLALKPAPSIKNARYPRSAQ